MKPWNISMRYLNTMIALCWVLVVAMVICIFWLAAHDDSAWTAFVLKHHCSEVISYDSDAVEVRSWVTTNKRSAWLCDDGITYIKAD